MAFVILFFLLGFKAEAAETVTITFKANGGSGSMSKQTVVKNEETQLKANSFSASSTTNGFWMWNTASDGTGTYYADKDLVTLSANTTLYAQWKKINETKITSEGGTLSSGYYKLTGNLAISNVIVIAANENVVIDLNGYVLTIKDGIEEFIIRNRGTLTLKDSRPTVKHYGKVNSNNLWKWDSSKDGASTTPSGYVCIEGGIITGSNPASSNGAAIYNNGNAKTKAVAKLVANGGNIVGNNCNYSDGAGSAIRSYTSNMSETNGYEQYGVLILNGIRVAYNYHINNAGGIYASGKVFINGCKIDNNKSPNKAGAIRITSQYDTEITITDSTITNNIAGNDGGAINISTGNAGATSRATKPIISNIKNTVISNNVGPNNGGAISMYDDPGVDVILNIYEGTIIKGNTSKNGAGIYMGFGNINMNGGEIYSNTASVAGGGVYLKDGVFTINGGKIGDEGLNNNATTGGGIHIEDGNAIINGGEIKYNQATTNGGGLYVGGGNLEILGGNFLYNIAENGGGAYVKNGLLELKGGIFEGNIANVDGGAVGVSGGNVLIEDGTIKNSKAVNGAGVYVSNGNIEMTGGSILNNQAKENGGGIYASSDSQALTVKIHSGLISGNIASKNGGGVGVNMASGLTADIIVGLEECKGLDNTHSHPIIKDNTANEYGGGFWLNGDEEKMTMNMYCGSVIENIAILESGSSNIYQTGGDAIVHAGEVGEGVIIIGGEYTYLPDNQIPKIQITYNSNDPEDVANSIEKTAMVTIGVEIYLPKNLFQKENYVLVGWAYNQNPSVGDEIFEAGGPYNVIDKDVTVYAVWKLEGSGNIQNPTIKSGKHYNEITEKSTNIMISQDGTFTVQMSVLDVQPNYYKNRTLIFDKNLINGTNITMIDLTDSSSKKYYNYKVENDTTKEIPLSNFWLNGKNDKYKDSEIASSVNETFLFIVELPQNNENARAMQLTLKRNSADEKIAAIEQSVTYTTTEKRKFDITYNENDINKDNVKITYQTQAPIGEDIRYNNKNVFMIISGEEIPEETKIFDGTSYYTQNCDGKYIIPIGEINKNKEINLKLISKTFDENEMDINLDIDIVATTLLEKIGMGDKITELKNIEIKSIKLPAIKLELNKIIYNQDDFENQIQLNYNARQLEGSNLSLELQKKVSSNSYVTQTNLLTSVDENQENLNGVFELDLNSSGNINLEFSENFKEQVGTYRILLKGIDLNGNEFEVPGNFMVQKSNN